MLQIILINLLRLYYDEKSRWKIQMETQKMRIYELERALVQTKVIYKEAMVNLSKISEEVIFKSCFKFGFF